MNRFRTEQDAMGQVEIPAQAYYGAGTMRAVHNFVHSGLRLPACFIQELARIKKHSAMVNAELGLLSPAVARGIQQSAQEVQSGELLEQFVVDVFQTGSGTSTNMNMNEVLACRANEIITGQKHGKSPVHPNDHVNLGQSSNDVIPTAIHTSAALGLRNRLDPALQELDQDLEAKALEFEHIKKIGRTHLQDAVPITLGQEFSGYAAQIRQARQRIEQADAELLQLALGGTAVGNGLNTHPEFAARVIQGLSRETGVEFQEAANHFAAQAAQDASVQVSAALRTLAVSLVKIAGDLRWLASGPRCGLGEINLPALQPGSSIMPGKINPVIPESILQIAAKVQGNDASIALGGQGGQFQLNTMLPLIAYNLLQSIELLALGSENFTRKCIRDISANKEKCEENVYRSLALATFLQPWLGYDQAAEVAGKAQASGQDILDILRQEGLLSE
ncbi:MAG: class II fumarate hydratase, partial [Thermodesulfobacteriota bacterium]